VSREAVKRLSKQNLWKWAKKAGLVGAGGLGTAAVIGNVRGQKAPEEMFTELLPLDGESRADAILDQYLSGTGAYQRPDAADLVGDYDQYASAAQSDLNSYLQALSGYGQGQSQNIASAYQQLSKDLLTSAEDEFTRGQMTAADIDALYGALAGEQAALAAGEGLSAPTSATTGLVAPSGEMATAPEGTRVYGRSLGDYLGRESGIESAAIERTAQSQALQGAALAQSLKDYIAFANMQRQAEMNQQVLSGRQAVSQAQADRDLQLSRDEQDYNRQADQLRLERDMETAKAVDLAVNTAARMWNNAAAKGKDDPIYRELVRNFGTRDRMLEYAEKNPRSFLNLFGIPQE
jgi:hypothetical protein